MYALKKKKIGVFYVPLVPLDAKHVVNSQYTKIYKLHPDTYIHCIKTFIPDFS